MAQVLESKPLLKFEDEKAYLAQEGLDMIDKVKGPIYPIILVGDGRAGKSYLAGRFLNVEEIFVTSDEPEAVTEGIDVVMAPFSQLQSSLPADLLPPRPEGEDMTVMMLDCEGGNNAMAAIRTLVNVFGILIGTEVVFVAGGSFSEAAIQNLGASLAARSLIKLGDGSKLQAPKLVFVVNKNTLKYKDSTLEDSLHKEQKDQGRKDNRNIILDTFEKRDFHAIPLFGFPDFEDKVTELKKTIIGDARALNIGNANVAGPQLVGLLKIIVEQMESMNEVSFPSMSRYVIFDGFLKPIVEKLTKEAEALIPVLTDYDKDLDGKDPRPIVEQKYDELSGHISEKSLVEEGRNMLHDGLTTQWENVKQINEAIGVQIKETKTETNEIFGSEKKVPVGGKGLLAKVMLRQQTVRMETRTVSTNKKGEVITEDWKDSGRSTLRIVETAFTNFSKEVPTVFGKLSKKSPSAFKNMITLGAGVYQERACMIKEGHLLWWDPDAVKEPTDLLNGAINMLINHATVVECEDEHCFIIKPSVKVGKWNEPDTFSGGHDREILFSCEGHDKPRETWVDAIRRNSKFAEEAWAQIGEDRVRAEVGNDMPKLSEAMWGTK